MEGQGRQHAEEKPGHCDALRLKAALATAETTPPPTDRLESTGALKWEKHRPGVTTFRAYHGDRVVGHIFKRADHSGSDSDVYSVTISDQVVAENIHHIKDARVAGEAAFSEFSAKAKP
jgi:inner membrane protein involved in colicin E2 resistance